MVEIGVEPVVRIRRDRRMQPRQTSRMRVLVVVVIDRPLCRVLEESGTGEAEEPLAQIDRAMASGERAHLR